MKEEIERGKEVINKEKITKSQQEIIIQQITFLRFFTQHFLILKPFKLLGSGTCFSRNSKNDISLLSGTNQSVGGNCCCFRNANKQKSLIGVGEQIQKQENSSNSKSDTDDSDVQSTQSAQDFDLNEILIEGYKVIRYLAKGKFGLIFLIQKLNTIGNMEDNLLAAKKLLYNPKYTDEINEELFEIEIRNLGKINKQVSYDTSHIVKLIQIKRKIANNQKNIYFIMEYMKGGSLRKFLDKRKILDEQTARFFIKQIAEGLKILYECNIVHRDLKPENILLDDRKYPSIVKICDLGLSIDLDQENIKSRAGTFGYMSPEVLKLSGIQTFKVDL